MDPSSKKDKSSFDALFTSARVVHRRSFLAAGTATLLAAAGGADMAFAKQAPVQAASEQDKKFMAQAIELMRKAGVTEKTGGPFGAVVVMNGEVLASSGNSVLRDNDPTAHAEVNAIRMACKKAGSPHIKGATLFSSCEPCPLCYSASYWARVGKIYYAAAWTDYADLFDDANINQDMKRPYPNRTVPVAQLMRSDAQKVWLDYRKMPDRKSY